MKNNKTNFKVFTTGLATVLALFSLTPNPVEAREFNFRFSFQGQTWEHPVSAESWKEAYEQASEACFNHFTGSSGAGRVRVDEDTADALLNSCTNPR